MILIADSGSTKTEWRLISNTQAITGTCITKGINPFYQTTDNIIQSLKEEYSLKHETPQHIYFYGAGCANKEKNDIVEKAISAYFNTNDITISSDLTGAAHSLCQHEEGIACIIGTGSNSCYYNGFEVKANVSPLGFIIGDEGSGAALGRKLISDLLKNQLPKSVIDLFFNSYPTSKDEILDNIYKKPFPNRYLAQYTKFLSANIHIKELEELVISLLEEFIKRNVMQYKNAETLKIHFTGSIAFYFKPQLKQAINKFNLTLGHVSKSPMEGLIKYHKQQNESNDKRQ